MRPSPWEKAAFILLPLAALAVVSAGATWFAAVSCDEVGEMSGRRVEYRLISGCYVEVNGRMIPRDSWRGEETR